MAIAQRLKELRQKAGWNQNQLAHQANVPRQVISRLEAGQRDGDNMTVSVAKRLARALQVSVDHLVGMYDEDNEPGSRARHAREEPTNAGDAV